MLMTTVLVGDHLPEEILWFLTDMKFSFLDFKFLDFNIDFLDYTYYEWKIEKYMPVPVYVSGLERLDYFTGSFFINNLQLIKAMLLSIGLWLIGLTIYFIAKCCRRAKKANVCVSLFENITASYPFGIFFRVGIEIYLFFTLTALQEVYYTITSPEHILSFVFAILGLIISLSFTMILPIHLIYICCKRQKIKSKEYDPKKGSLAEFYGDLKQSKVRYALYWLVFFLRRLLTIIIILLAPVITSWAALSLFFLVQACVLLYTLIFRPFANRADNLIEGINEFMFVSMCAAMLAGNTSTWPEWLSLTVLSLLIATGYLVTLIQIVQALIDLGRKIREKCRRGNKVEKLTSDSNLGLKTSREDVGFGEVGGHVYTQDKTPGGKRMKF